MKTTTPLAGSDTKIIWMCWFQGWDNAPDLCKLCVESWRYHNPDWKIVLLDNSNLIDYIDIESVLPGVRDLAPNAAYSDIIRLFLLRNYGGVWADSSVFCNKPLDEWVHPATKDAWLFYRSDRSIASWFISAEKHSYIMGYWYDRMVEYWTERLAGKDRFGNMYMWVHALFTEATKEDEKFNNIFQSWDKIDVTCGKGLPDPNSRGLGAHYFTPYHRFMNEPLTEESKNRVDTQLDYVYKLNYRQPIAWRANTTLQYLIRSIDIEINFE